MGLVNTFAALTGIFAPMTVGYFTTNVSVHIRDSIRLSSTMANITNQFLIMKVVRDGGSCIISEINFRKVYFEKFLNPPTTEGGDYHPLCFSNAIFYPRNFFRNASVHLWTILITSTSFGTKISKQFCSHVNLYIKK